MAGAKEQRWYWQAEEWWVVQGLSYDQIAAKIKALGDSVSKASLSAWAKKGDWETKRGKYLRTARGLAPELEKQLEEKARHLLAEAGELDLAALKELNQMLKLIKGLSKTGPSLAEMSLEVMGAFAEHSRDNIDDPAEMEILSRHIGAYLDAVGRLT